MFVGIVSVDAANNGDNLYVYCGFEDQFTGVSSKPMTYSSNLYTTVIDFTGVAGWTWYLLSISTSDSDRKVCWNDQPTIISNTDKIQKFQSGSRGEYTNLVKFETNGNASAGTSDLVKVTYDITAKTITFDPGDSEPPTDDPTTYYLGGRFKMKTAAGAPIDTYTGTQYEWTTTESKNIQFNKTADGVYELNTYSTVSELSALSQGNQPPFFIVHDGKNMFGGSSAYHTFQDNTSENKASLKSINNTDDESTLLRFDGTDESGNVIIHLDTNSGNKIWCTIDGGSDLTPGAITLTSDGSTILYFNMSAVSWWPAKGNFAYFYNSNSNDNLWSAKAEQYSGNTYYVKIPSGTWDHVILTRNSVTLGPEWLNKVNQTGDIALDTDSNYISKFEENKTDATWGTVKPTSSASLSASSTSVKTGVDVTLTPSLTSNTTYNAIKSTSYSVSPSSGASVSDNKFTATAAGTYTVTATVTYNAKGYSGLTSTATASTTITVESATPQKYTVTYGSNNGTYGTVSATVGSDASVDAGTEVTFTATPKSNYKVEAWYSDTSWNNKISGTDGKTEYKATINANTTVYVKFVQNSASTQEYGVEGNANGLPGWDKDFSATQKFDSNNEIKLTGVLANQQFRLIGKDEKRYGWDANYEVKSNVSNLQIKQDVNYVFQFNNAGNYTIKLEQNSIPPFISITQGEDSEYSLWDNVTKTKLGDFSSGSTGSFTVKLTANQDYKLYVQDSSSGKYYNRDKAFNNNSVALYNYTSVDDLISYTPTATGDYTFTWTPFMYGDQKAGTLTVQEPTVAPQDVTPTFVSGGATDSVSAYVGKEKVLDVTATLQGVSNPQEYLTYSTVCDNGLEITLGNTANPKFTATAEGTYTVTTTVTNTANQQTATRTTTVNVTVAPAVVYQVAIKSGSPVDMHETSVAGVYISDSIISKDTCFRIKDTEGKYAQRGDIPAPGTTIDSTYDISSPNDRNAKVFADWLDSYSSSGANGDWKINCGDAYVVYDSNKGIIYLSTDPNNKQSFTIYAKPGTVRNNKDFHETTGSLGYGTTTVAGAGDVDETREIWYSTTRLYKDVAEDTAITITTTMTNQGDAGGYYVWAFCVNGKYVEAIKDADTNGNVIYRSPTYRLTSENAVNNKFEITPIYLNRTIEADGDYIHLYVDASTVTDTWGDTIAVYPYVGTGVTQEDRPFGHYPGQPMVLRGRFYEILVPRHKYVMTDGKLTKTNTYMSGLTVCNYAEETIHPEVIGYTTNYQTYDYSDFIQLSKDPNVKAVLFAIKRYTDNDNGLVASNQTIGSTISNDWNNLDVNRFEDFTDYYGRNTDIFGNILSEEDMNKSKKVHIISVGNQDTNSETGDYFTKGTWATKWFIYDNNGRLLSVGTPSEYINQNSPKYKALLENYRNDCQYLQTYISYDKEKTSGGVRSDGRWYYSKVGDLEFTSDVAIEYNSGNGEWIEDKNSGVKNEDGFVSTVTNGSVARLDGVREATYKSVDGTATISVDVKDGWTFAGWYIKSKNADDSYSYYEISKTNTTVNDFQMNNSYHIVARLEKIPEGSLVLRHTQYSGTNPPAHSGGSIVGQYFIMAVVKDRNNNVVGQPYDFTEDPISIAHLRSDYTIDITLKTVCYEPNTFYSWYQMAPDGNYFPIGPEDYDPKGQDGELTFEMNLKCSQLFNGQDLEVNVIRFYSDLVKVSGTCDITYKYYDRFAENGVGKMVSYVVNDVELSPKEIKEGYIPSDETIQRNAPYIDTIYLDTIWDLTDAGKVTKTKSYAEVTASQRDKMCKVYYHTGEYFNDGIVESKPVPFNAFLGENDANDPDKINFLLTAPDKNAEGKEFSYWNIYKAGENGQKTETLIATCYDRTFNFRIYDDYYLEVVYGEKIDEISAEISDPVMNREIFGSASSATDRLYVDLLVSYYSSRVPVFKDNNPDNTGYTVECGVIVDRNNTKTLSDADMNSIKEAAQNDTELDPTILQGYFNNFGLDVDKALSVAQNQELGDKSKTTYMDTSGCEHRLSKYVLNNEDLTNKNRIDKVLVYTNNEANQKYIFAAYAYVIVRDAVGTIVQCDISNANEVQFYNLCYTANIPAQTSAN